MSIIGKWLSKGFMDNRIRVLYEQKLISEGRATDEAARKWIEEYSKIKNYLTPPSIVWRVITLITLITSYQGYHGYQG